DLLNRSTSLYPLLHEGACHVQKRVGQRVSAGGTLEDGAVSGRHRRARLGAAGVLSGAARASLSEGPAAGTGRRGPGPLGGSDAWKPQPGGQRPARGSFGFARLEDRTAA